MTQENQTHGRVPPHNLDAERSLLGGLLLEDDQFDAVAEIVGPADFYRDVNRKIFAAMSGLWAKTVRVDRVAVKEALTAAGDFEAVGGDEYIDLLDKFVPTATNLPYYAKVIREKAQVRRTIEAAGSIAQLGYDQLGEVPQFLDEAQRRMLEATESRVQTSGPEVLKPIIARAFKAIERDYERQTEVTGLATGLIDLDRRTSGFSDGDLIILAARPSVGKTACAIGWATHAAVRLGVGVAVFSLEMPSEQLVKRMLASEARVDAQRIRTGLLIESDWAKLANSAGTLADAPMEIDETRGLSALEIRSRARRVARTMALQGKRLGLIVVDYLTLLRMDDSSDSVSARVGRNALRLKELAGELKLPVVCLAQLNREPARGGKIRKPVLTDLRDSGEIEQHADVVIFIHRESEDPTEDSSAQHLLIIEKQRNGPIGSVAVTFDAEHVRFDSLSNANPPHWQDGAKA